ARAPGVRRGRANRRQNEPPLAPIPPYRPDRLTNYEIGWKTSWFDNTLRFNGAIYIDDWNNFQVSFLGLNSFTEIHNAGSARIYGSELDATWIPVDGLTISGAATITDAHLTKDYCGPITPAGVIATFCPGPDDPFGPDSPKGTALPVPKYKTNWTARYEFPLEQFQAHV